MATNDEITTKFKVDITDLKANIQEANRQIKLANSEFKAATAGMDDWSSSADGLSAKLKQLNTVHEEEVKKLDSLKKQYELIIQEQGENSKAAQNLMIRINNQQASVSRIEKSIDQYKNRLNELNTSSSQAETATDRLTNEISRQETELNQLKSKYKDIILSQGEASDEAKQLAKEIVDLSESLQSNKIKMADADEAAEKLSRAIDKTSNTTNEANKNFTLMDGVLAGLISNGISNGISKIGDFVSSLFELGDATEEYRSMMTKIEGSANSFGYSIDFAKDKYSQFYSYLGDDQMATNAITNLMGMKVSTDSVSDSADAAIAVWSAYGDSIPIESLTESMNESAQVAQVTGTLADTINWAKRSNEEWSIALSSNKAAQEAFNKAIAEGETQEDAYSAALAACSSTQERADLIAKTLIQTYGQSKATYDDLAGSLIETNKAQLELKETQAELADTLAPLQNKFTQLQNKALKTMSPLIEDVTDEFIDLIDDIDWDGAADTIGDMLETTADGLHFVADNIEPISVGVKAMATAWAVYKASQLAANAVTKTSNALLAITKTAIAASTTATLANAAATNTATVATKALAVAQKMTPWGLVAGLVTGAVVGLVSWANASSDAAENSDKNTIATKKLAEEYEKLADSINESKESWDNRLESTQSEISSAEILAEKLDQLASKTNKTNAEKAQMEYYVSKLNELIPELNLQYDAEKDALNKTSEAIQQNIKHQKELALAKASQENMTEIAQKMADAELKLAKATEQHEKNKKKLTETTEAYNKAYDEWIKSGAESYGQQFDAMEKAADAQSKALKNFEESEETVNDYKKSVEDLNDEFETMDNFAKEKINSAELEKQLDAIIEQAKAKGIEVPEAVANGIREGKYALPSSVEEMQSLISYKDLTKKAKDAGVSVPKTISEGIKSGELLPSHAVNQLQAWINFNDLLNKSSAAGKAVPDYLQQQILAGQLKPAEAVQYMKDLISYTDMLQKAKDAGINVPEEITNGVNSGQTKPADAINQINALMTAAANSSALPMNSAGQNAGSNYTGGVGSDSNIINAIQKGTQLATAAKDGVESVKTKSSGQFFGEGFIEGIGSKISGAITAGANLAIAALSGLRNAGREGSPWKTTIESGEFAGEGLAIGLEKKSKKVNKSASLLVKDMIKTMNDEQKNNDIGNILDVNDLKTGMSANMANAKSNFVSSPKVQSEVKDITFNQYNYSPKSLSRLDIYRQTHNQLFAAKRSLK